MTNTQVRKGQAMTGGEYPGRFVSKRAPLPADLAQFEAACLEADRLEASSLDEIEARIEHARKLLTRLQALTGGAANK